MSFLKILLERLLIYDCIKIHIIIEILFLIIALQKSGFTK